MVPELSVSSLASSSCLTTPTMEDSIVFSSDLESESSRVTIQEKHNSEYKEKELRLGSVDLDNSDDANMTSPPNSPTSPLPLVVVGTHIPQKRSSEPSPTQTQPDESSIPPLPRKKRPNITTTSPAEESIHVAEQGGYTIKELLEYCRIKQRKGLYREYAQIRAEPPSGIFEQAK